MIDASPIRDLRKSMGFNQADFAALLGLASAGHISRLESGDLPPALPVAIKLEELGREHGVAIDAAALNEGVALARAACLGGCEAVSAVHDGDVSSEMDVLSAGKAGEISRARTQEQAA